LCKGYDFFPPCVIGNTGMSLTGFAVTQVALGFRDSLRCVAFVAGSDPMRHLDVMI
jgi:hypothetical protein